MHNINDCNYLISDIEALIQRGYLKQYVSKGEQPLNSTPKVASEVHPEEHVMQAISASAGWFIWSREGQSFGKSQFTKKELCSKCFKFQICQEGPKNHRTNHFSNWFRWCPTPSWWCGNHYEDSRLCGSEVASRHWHLLWCHVPLLRHLPVFFFNIYSHVNIYNI